MNGGIQKCTDAKKTFVLLVHLFGHGMASMKNVKMGAFMRIAGVVQNVMRNIYISMEKLVIFIVCLHLLGCRQTTSELKVFEGIPENSDIERIIIENIDENSVLKYTDIFDFVNYIKLETVDNSLIGRIDKIIKTDDKFIILDGSIAKMVFVCGYRRNRHCV